MLEPQSSFLKDYMRSHCDLPACGPPARIPTGLDTDFPLPTLRAVLYFQPHPHIRRTSGDVLLTFCAAARQAVRATRLTIAISELPPVNWPGWPVNTLDICEHNARQRRTTFVVAAIKTVLTFQIEPKEQRQKCP